MPRLPRFPSVALLGGALLILALWLPRGPMRNLRGQSFPICRNGLLETSEECETNSPCPGGLICDAKCQCNLPPAVCGNAERETAEVCDWALVNDVCDLFPGDIPGAGDRCTSGCVCASCRGEAAPPVAFSTLPGNPPSYTGLVGKPDIVRLDDRSALIIYREGRVQYGDTSAVRAYARVASLDGSTITLGDPVPFAPDQTLYNLEVLGGDTHGMAAEPSFFNGMGTPVTIAYPVRRRNTPDDPLHAECRKVIATVTTDGGPPTMSFGESSVLIAKKETDLNPLDIDCTAALEKESSKDARGGIVLDNASVYNKLLTAVFATSPGYDVYGATLLLGAPEYPDSIRNGAPLSTDAAKIVALGSGLEFRIITSTSEMVSGKVIDRVDSTPLPRPLLALGGKMPIAFGRQASTLFPNGRLFLHGASFADRTPFIQRINIGPTGEAASEPGVFMGTIESGSQYFTPPSYLKVAGNSLVIYEKVPCDTLCGNGQVDPGELCGEPRAGLSFLCPYRPPLDLTCQNCRCTGNPVQASSTASSLLPSSSSSLSAQVSSAFSATPSSSIAASSSRLSSPSSSFSSFSSSSASSSPSSSFSSASIPLPPPSSTSRSSSSLQSSAAASSLASAASTFVIRCGDGILSPGEACDTGHPCPDNGFCMANCQCQARSSAASSAGPIAQPPRCGNGLLEFPEQCDTGFPCPNNGFCTASCQCQERPGGSSSVRSLLAQGPTIPLPASSAPSAIPPILSLPLCSNGLLEFPEECETSIPCVDTTYTCINCHCIPPICGDGRLNLGEECDDGNTVSGDGCSAACLREVPTMIAAQPICGNGLIEQGEECDDGNTISGDGCSPSCILEAPSQPSPREPLNLTLMPQLQPAAPAPSSSSTASSSSSSSSTQPLQPPQLPKLLQPQPITVPFSPQPIAKPQPQPSLFQPYASVVPYAPVSGPVGRTGPASLAVMAAGAAAGFAWMRRKRTKDKGLL